MKKWIAVLLAAVMCLVVLTGCGGDGDQTSAVAEMLTGLGNSAPTTADVTMTLTADGETLTSTGKLKVDRGAPEERASYEYTYERLPLAEDDPADIVNGKLVYSGIIYAEGGYVKVQQGDEIGQFESIGEGVAYARFNVSEDVLTDAKGENMKLTAKVAADKTEGVFGVNLGVEVQMELTFDADMKLTGATLNYSKDGATVNITVSYGYAAQEISIPASGSTAEA